jgi:peptide-methionine (S)-S-oxide reductase
MAARVNGRAAKPTFAGLRVRLVEEAIRHLGSGMGLNSQPSRATAGGHVSSGGAMMSVVVGELEEVTMRIAYSIGAVAALALGSAVFFYGRGKPLEPARPTLIEPSRPVAGTATATFGGGCFWCTEAVFQQLKGVKSVLSGYTGGSAKNPTYEQVCSGTTGHAEAIQISYDPSAISYEELLEVFWKTHDPTTPDQQGNDVGTQYRSAIFYHNDEQKRLAEHYKQKLDASGLFPAPIVTEIVPSTEFYRAEAYHQNFYAQNSSKPYCRVVIRPKLDKMKAIFSAKLTTASER